jgi:hypothetical protein
LVSRRTLFVVANVCATGVYLLARGACRPKIGSEFRLVVKNPPPGDALAVGFCVLGLKERTE